MTVVSEAKRDTEDTEEIEEEEEECEEKKKLLYFTVHCVWCFCTVKNTTTSEKHQNI